MGLEREPVWREAPRLALSDRARAKRVPSAGIKNDSETKPKSRIFKRVREKAFWYADDFISTSTL